MRSYDVDTIAPKNRREGERSQSTNDSVADEHLNETNVLAFELAAIFFAIILFIFKSFNGFLNVFKLKCLLFCEDCLTIESEKLKINNHKFGEFLCVQTQK